MLLKPGPLVVKKKGDPEQLSKEWEDYIKIFREFLAATGVVGAHATPEVAGTPCPASGPDLSMGKVGSCPGPPHFRGPPQM